MVTHILALFLISFYCSFSISLLLFFGAFSPKLKSHPQTPTPWFSVRKSVASCHMWAPPVAWQRLLSLTGARSGSPPTSVFFRHVAQWAPPRSFWGTLPHPCPSFTVFSYNLTFLIHVVPIKLIFQILTINKRHHINEHNYSLTLIVLIIYNHK